MMKMIDETIKRFEDNAEFERTHGNLQGCLEFRQLAEWLKDYKRMKEQKPCEDATLKDIFCMGCEYKEPTTKNDLAVDCISRKAVLNTIRDWWKVVMMADGKPTLCDSIRELPAVTPQEPKSEWQKAHDILKAYSDGANEMLEKIRAEIVHLHDWAFSREEILRIIDEYKGE